MELQTEIAAMTQTKQPLSLMELVHGITEVFKSAEKEEEKEKEKEKEKVKEKEATTSTSDNSGAPSFSPSILFSLHSLLSAYSGVTGEWKRFAFWDDHRKYTRNLIATDHHNFTLMLLCWNPLIASPIHNHSGSECFMKVLEGEIVETRYKPQEEKVMDGSHMCPLRVLCRRCISPGEIAFINDTVGLHKVDSLSSHAVTLHLYIPPYEQCQCYEEETGRKQQGYVTFYSENGLLLAAHTE